MRVVCPCEFPLQRWASSQQAPRVTGCSSMMHHASSGAALAFLFVSVDVESVSEGVA